MNVTYVMEAPRQGPHRGAWPSAPTDTLLVGTSASTKLHKSAVKRNRMRRRCREALRLTVKQEKTIPSCQLIISPRSSSLQCDFGELLKDAESFLRLIANR